MPTSTSFWRVYKMTGSISSLPSPLLPCLHHPLPAAADAPPSPLSPVGPSAPPGVPHPGCSLPGKQDGHTQPCHHLCPNPFPLLKVCKSLSSCKPLCACDHKKGIGSMSSLGPRPSHPAPKTKNWKSAGRRRVWSSWYRIPSWDVACSGSL